MAAQASRRQISSCRYRRSLSGGGVHSQDSRRSACQIEISCPSLLDAALAQLVDGRWYSPRLEDQHRGGSRCQVTRRFIYLALSRGRWSRSSAFWWLPSLAVDCADFGWGTVVGLTVCWLFAQWPAGVKPPAGLRLPAFGSAFGAGPGRRLGSSGVRSSCTWSSSLREAVPLFTSVGGVSSTAGGASVTNGASTTETFLRVTRRTVFFSTSSSLGVSTTTVRCSTSSDDMGFAPTEKGM